MSTNRYPRTPHLPWSLSRTDDDIIIEDCRGLVGEEVVILEKIDGENTGMCKNAVFTRSGEFRKWDGRSRMHALHSRISRDIPEHFQICGENAYAKHTIAYDKLPAHFLVFSIFDHENGSVLGWDETVGWATLLGLNIVPVLWRGVWDEAFVRRGSFWLPQCGTESEGYVVRPARSFPLDDFAVVVGKFRARNTETSENYMRERVIPNTLSVKGGKRE